MLIPSDHTHPNQFVRIEHSLDPTHAMRHTCVRVGVWNAISIMLTVFVADTVESLIFDRCPLRICLALPRHVKSLVTFHYFVHIFSKIVSLTPNFEFQLNILSSSTMSDHNQIAEIEKFESIELKTALRAILASQKYVCTTADVWTPSTRRLVLLAI